jgi:DNA-binding NarL/FixJ family response regulator
MPLRVRGYFLLGEMETDDLQSLLPVMFRSQVVAGSTAVIEALGALFATLAAHPTPVLALDTHEYAVLRRVVWGETDAAIATALGLGYRTIQRTVDALMQRFAVRGRPALAAQAAIVGLITTEDTARSRETE